MAEAKLIEAMARGIHDKDRDRLPAWEELNTAYQKIFTRQAVAALSAAEEAGYAIVPREPTDAMVKAGHGEMPVEYRYWPVLWRKRQKPKIYPKWGRKGDGGFRAPAALRRCSSLSRAASTAGSCKPWASLETLSKRSNGVGRPIRPRRPRSMAVWRAPWNGGAYATLPARTSLPATVTPESSPKREQADD